jgi:cob(I)alamin adenosyltransferase
MCNEVAETCVNRLRRRPAARYRGSMPGGRGLLMVYTGDGKGKTSAAMGTALRAVGHGFKVLMIQFIKGSWKYGELDAAPMLGGAFEIRPMGRGFINASAGELDPEDTRLAKQAWISAVAAIHSSKYDILILDEINNALDYGMLPLAEVLAELAARPEDLHIICTGRNAPPALIEAADLVSEMRAVKHPYDRGIQAQRGIEY